MTVTPIRRHKPQPADREFQASMARNLARIVADYDTAGTTPEVAADVRAIPDLLHAIAAVLDALTAHQATETARQAARDTLAAALKQELDR